MSSLFRRKLDELEDMFIASQDNLLARFSATYEENERLKAEVETLKKAVDASPIAMLKLKELQGKNTYEEINPKNTLDQ